MELKQVKTVTTWEEAAKAINDNNQSIKTQMDKLSPKMRGFFMRAEDLESHIPQGAYGDIAFVGENPPFNTYIWNGTSWEDQRIGFTPDWVGADFIQVGELTAGDTVISGDLQVRLETTLNDMYASRVFVDDKIYANGIGGYEGSYSASAKDLATFINEHSAFVKGETKDNAKFEDADNIVNGKCSLNVGWKSEIEGTATLLSGYQNTVKSSYSHAEGSNNYICLRGAYIKFINSAGTRLYMTEFKGKRGTKGNWEEAESAEFISRLRFKVGDVISIITDTLYENCAKVTSVIDNRLDIELLNGVSIERNIAVDVNASRYCLVYSFGNPEAGVVEMSKQSHVEGELNEIYSDDCHVEGRENIALAPHSHVEGRGNISTGDCGHAEGRGTVVNNFAEHAEGKYNVSNPNTISSVGIGYDYDDRRNAIEVTNNGDVFIYGVGGYDGTSQEGAKSIAEVIGNAAGSYISTTYSDFVSKVNNSELIAGCLYRLTDYETIIENSSRLTSAGHPFDIVVLAISNNSYSEECWAVQSEREGGNYFDNCNLSRWKVWWKAEPKTGEYEWANDAPNHKGVIYRLIDENNNDLPYDFKNILVKGEYTLSLKTYDGLSDASVNTDSDRAYRAYDITPMHDITMKGLYADWEGSWRFPYNIVRNYDALGISDGYYYGYTCRNIFMDYGCNNNVIEDGENIRLGKYCEGNSILGSDGYGGFAYNITLGDQCFENKIGTGGDGSGGDICDITIGDNCVNNTIEDWVYNITMTNSSSNTIASESVQVELTSAGNCYIGAGSNNCVVRNCGSVMTPGWVSGVTYQNINDQNLDTDTRIIGSCYVTQDSNGNVVVKSPDDKSCYHLEFDIKDLKGLRFNEPEVLYNNTQSLKDAISKNQVILIPYDKNNLAKGGCVANVIFGKDSSFDRGVFISVQVGCELYILEDTAYDNAKLLEFWQTTLKYINLAGLNSIV